MDLPGITARQVATTAGYLLLGAVGTALAAMGLLNFLQPLQPVLYRVVYSFLGPVEATKVAILGHFVVSGAVAVAVATAVGEYVGHRGENHPAFLVGYGVMAVLVVAFLVLSTTGLASLLLAFLWVVALAVAVPLVLRYRHGVRSSGVTAFVGGVPVLVLLLLLAGFGLGWGWGYVLTAEEVPGGTVNDDEVADFDGVPAVRDDLFGGDCSETGEGTRTCYLQLRGYEHEMTAMRFLDRHGVRCPYQGTGADPGSFVARHDGEYYRVSCSPHGD